VWAGVCSPFEPTLVACDGAALILIGGPHYTSSHGFYPVAPFPLTTHSPRVLQEPAAVAKSIWVIVESEPFELPRQLQAAGALQAVASAAPSSPTSGLSVACSSPSPGEADAECPSPPAAAAAAATAPHSAGDLWLLLAKHRICSVIVNLLQNAIKFSPPGGRVTVNIAAVVLPPSAPSHLKCSWPSWPRRSMGAGAAASSRLRLRTAAVVAPAAHTGAAPGSGAADTGVQSPSEVYSSAVALAPQRPRELTTAPAAASGDRPGPGSAGPADADGSRLRISIQVRDRGVGIAADDIPQLFQPFVQVRAGTLQQGRGTGLGLAIARRLAQLHGGDITVESAEGQGSTFTFTFVAQGTSARSSEAESAGLSDPPRLRAAGLASADAVPASSFALPSPTVLNAASGLDDAAAASDVPIPEWEQQSRRQSPPRPRFPGPITRATQLGSMVKPPLGGAQLAPTRTPAPRSTQPLLPPINASRWLPSASPELVSPSGLRISPVVNVLRAAPSAESLLSGRSSSFLGGESPARARASAARAGPGLLSDGPLQPDAAVPPASGASPSAAEMAAALQRLRVRALVVDDSESNLAMLARALRSLGMAVETAVNGQEAVDATAARQGTPEAFTLITCDKTMPVLSGVGAVRQLRAAPTAFAGVIVGITGDAAAADRAEFEAAGVNAMLTKPVSKAELVRALYPLLVDAPPRSAGAASAAASAAASEPASPAESP